MLNPKKDTLEIQLLKYLPVGKNWKWKKVKMAYQNITSDSNNIHINEITPIKLHANIDKSKQEEFLNSLSKQNINLDWETNISKLEVLSLMDNVKAWEILKNYETFIEQKTDGALAETWKEAVANVKWHQNN